MDETDQTLRGVAMKRGDRFEHARLIIGSPKAGMRPDVCQVTRVSKMTTYYVNESGMHLKHATARMSEVVGRRLTPNE